MVLAAGGGLRFKGGRATHGGPAPEDAHKLLAPVLGRPLVRFAVDAAAGSGADETVVVTGAVDLTSVLPGGVTVIENARWTEGQATSVAVALDWCARQGHHVAVIGLGDVPGIAEAAWRAVLATRAPLAVATFAGRRHPPVRLERSVWAEVPIAGDEGARALLRGPGVVEVPCLGLAVDVDTVEDLARVEALLARAGGPAEASS